MSMGSQLRWQAPFRVCRGLEMSMPFDQETAMDFIILRNERVDGNAIPTSSSPGVITPRASG
jgi:hypothetical protein